jgi:hypothetical protein
MEELELESYFDLVITGDDVEKQSLIQKEF